MAVSARLSSARPPLSVVLVVAISSMIFVKSSASENQSETGIKNLIDGIQIVLNEMKSLLDKNQIKKIEPLHEKFDYNFHQAMFEAPSSDYDEGLILEVVQPGYVLHDRLIRPAMVGVSKGKIIEKEKNEEKKE